MRVAIGGGHGQIGLRLARLLTQRGDQAVALIRAEHPPLLRSACIHEELAQGMGLANDSPQARPSIFNDDEEFGLLTRHDELLLEMLYDPRLRTGMTLEEAEPVVRTIARELGVTVNSSATYEDMRASVEATLDFNGDMWLCEVLDLAEATAVAEMDPNAWSDEALPVLTADEVDAQTDEVVAAALEEDDAPAPAGMRM